MTRTSPKLTGEIDTFLVNLFNSKVGHLYLALHDGLYPSTLNILGRKKLIDPKKTLSYKFTMPNVAYKITTVTPVIWQDNMIYLELNPVKNLSLSGLSTLACSIDWPPYKLKDYI